MEDKHFVMANFNILHGMGIVSATRLLMLRKVLSVLYKATLQE